MSFCAYIVSLQQLSLGLSLTSHAFPTSKETPAERKQNTQASPRDVTLSARLSVPPREERYFPCPSPSPRRHLDLDSKVDGELPPWPWCWLRVGCHFDPGLLTSPIWHCAGLLFPDGSDPSSPARGVAAVLFLPPMPWSSLRRSPGHQRRSTARSLRATSK